MASHVTFKLLVMKTRQIENLRAFYQMVGLDLVEERHGNGPLHCAAEVESTVFELYPAMDGDSVDSSLRLGFGVSQLVETVELLRSNGAPIASEPKSTAWGMRAVVRDPDGRAVELFQQ